jgi:predicted TPR repeat methyltransferase
MDALAFLGDLSGKRVLEIGGKDGRMSSLLAMMGARVTMVDMCNLDGARAEVEKWSVADRVKLVRTRGGFEEIGDEKCDAVFTKSILVFIQDLAPFLDQIDAHLKEGGKVAFLENYRGGKTLEWLKQRLGGTADFRHYYGITTAQVPLFRERFANLTARRPHYLVWELFGYKKS